MDIQDGEKWIKLLLGLGWPLMSCYCPFKHDDVDDVDGFSAEKTNIKVKKSKEKKKAVVVYFLQNLAIWFQCKVNARATQSWSDTLEKFFIPKQTNKQTKNKGNKFVAALSSFWSRLLGKKETKNKTRKNFDDDV